MNDPDGVIEVSVPEMPPVPLNTKLLIVLDAVAPLMEPVTERLLSTLTSPPENSNWSEVL